MARCPHCREIYKPKRMGQKCCEKVECAMEAGQLRKEKTLRLQAKKLKAETKARKEANKKPSEIAAEVQVIFNKYIRLRDSKAGYGCISCGTKANVQYAAGHYRSRGASSALRFNEDNVFLQCNRNCNSAKGGNSIEMRKGMIKRIGLARVEAIENTNETHKWTREELATLKAIYRAKLKALLASG